jgi:GxxExxY protein
MGSGHSEAVYEACMALELGFDPFLTITRQVPCPLQSKGHVVGVGYIDILVDRKVVIELKSVAKLTPKDVQQVRKYLQAMDLDNGLLINFGNDLEIVEVTKHIPGVIEVPFELTPEANKEFKKAWEKKGDYEQTPSSED